MSVLTSPSPCRGVRFSVSGNAHTDSQRGVSKILRFEAFQQGGLAAVSSVDVGFYTRQAIADRRLGKVPSYFRYRRRHLQRRAEAVGADRDCEAGYRVDRVDHVDRVDRVDHVDRVECVGRVESTIDAITMARVEAASGHTWWFGSSGPETLRPSWPRLTALVKIRLRLALRGEYVMVPPLPLDPEGSSQDAGYVRVSWSPHNARYAKQMDCETPLPLLCIRGDDTGRSSHQLDDSVRPTVDGCWQCDCTVTACRVHSIDCI